MFENWFRKDFIIAKKKEKIAQPVRSTNWTSQLREKIWKKSKIRPRIDKKEYKKKDWNWTEIEQKKVQIEKGQIFTLWLEIPN